MTVVLKPNSTVLPDSFYDDLAALAATVDESPAPFAVADDFARGASPGKSKRADVTVARSHPQGFVLQDSSPYLGSD